MSEKTSISAEKDTKKHNWKLYLTIFTFVSLLVLVYFSLDKIIDTFSNLHNLRIGFLLSMVVWQFFNYHAYTRLYQELFGSFKTRIEYWPMYKLAIELNFVNHVFPSAGLAGFSYFGLRMKQLNASLSQSTLVQMMRFALIFISFQLLLVVGVFILAFDGRANNFTILIASSLGTLLLIGTVFTMYVAGSEKRINSFTVGLTKIINRLIQIVRPKHPETINLDWVKKLFLDLHKDYLILRRNPSTLKKPLFYATMANLTELATVYVVFLAFGQAVNPGAVILAYAIANFAGLIAVLPGGIGIYEALMVAVLAAGGVPVGLALPATVTYRILSMVIQLPLGYYYYQVAIKTIGENPIKS